MTRPPIELMNVVTNPQPELVFAVVAPIGTNFEPVESLFLDRMRLCRYEFEVIKLSRLAEGLNRPHLGVTVERGSEGSRIASLMTLGNVLRKTSGRGDVLALSAINVIAKSRTDAGRPGQPHERRVTLLNSLKHPDEVEALRRVYGPGFFLVGVNSTVDERLKFLTSRRGIPEEEARALLKRDEGEDDDLGQQTRSTFHLSDVFINASRPEELVRFLDMVFGAPFETPTRDEHAMFLAYAASMRSSQMGRQVGAVIMTAEGDVIATGTNDVPHVGGGLPWPGEGTDQRDHQRGEDSNSAAIDGITQDIIDVLDRQTPRPTFDRDQLRSAIRRGQVGDLTEFGRVVHAEMDAITSCARAGVSPRGATLYTTTFPCHNCAKHVVAAGIRKVVFVEPYPKSRALALHDDTITLSAADTTKVQFLPFVGVSARRYFDLFSMRLSGGTPLVRKEGSKPVVWKFRDAIPRLRMSPFSYMEREAVVANLFRSEVSPLLAPARPKAARRSKQRARTRSRR